MGRSAVHSMFPRDSFSTGCVVPCDVISLVSYMRFVRARLKTDA